MSGASYPPVELNADEVTVLDDGHGNKVNVVEYDGYFLAKKAIENGIIPDPRTNIPNIMKMKTRPEDVFLIAYPKAGTHWTWEIVTMLLRGSSDYINQSKGIAMLPFRKPEDIDSMASPRVINSHCYFRHLPEDIINNRNKLIFVTRNPKDLAVSYYHHCRHQAAYGGNFSQFLDIFMTDKVYHCSFYKYMLDWADVFDRHPEIPVHFISYENLQKNPIPEIEKLATFLRVPGTTELYEKIVDKCSFQKLQTSYRDRNNLHHMFRKGIVGDWKDVFSVADNEKFDQYLKEKLSNSRWSFTYSI